MKALVNSALYLAIITIVYNVFEGGISVYFGNEDEALTLFGFGADSLVEVISGTGILHMIIRMKKNSAEKRDMFERTALKVTGISFYLLTAGLIAGTVINIIMRSEPDTTLAGVVISVVSILTMYFLMSAKLKVGKNLNSDALIADANCTKTCFYLSFILLISSGAYELFKIAYIDIVGSLGIAYFAFREGKESIEKSASDSLACTCNH